MVNTDLKEDFAANLRLKMSEIREWDVFRTDIQAIIDQIPRGQRPIATDQDGNPVDLNVDDHLLPVSHSGLTIAADIDIQLEWIWFDDLKWAGDTTITTSTFMSNLGGRAKIDVFQEQPPQLPDFVSTTTIFGLAVGHINQAVWVQQQQVGSWSVSAFLKGLQRARATDDVDNGQSIQDMYNKLHPNINESVVSISINDTVLTLGGPTEYFDDIKLMNSLLLWELVQDYSAPSQFQGEG